MIWTVKLVFCAATLAYGIGYANRSRNNDLHRRMMALGFVLTLCIAAVLVVGVHGFGSTYGPAEWLLDLAGSPGAAHGVLLAHRAVATATFLALLAQVVSGWRRHGLHRRLYPLTIVLWMVSFVSGLVIFV